MRSTRYRAGSRPPSRGALTSGRVLATLTAAGALVLASLAVGGAAAKLCGSRPWEPYAPAAGIALLLAVATAAIELPGRAATAAVVLLVLALASAVVIRRELTWRIPGEAVAALAVVLLLTLVPFIASGRTGLLGVGINNDLASHLGWAEALRTESQTEPFPLPSGYPLGNHALAATLAEGLGIDMDRAFLGLLMAIPLLTVPMVLGALDFLTRPRRALAAVLVSMPYLLAAYYGQGAFKETLQALFVLAFVLLLRERRFGFGPAVLLGAIAAGCFLNYSYLGLGWLVATAAVWIPLEVIAAGGPRAVTARLRGRRPSGRTVLAVLAGVAALAIPIAPEIDRAANFFDEVSLSPSESGVISASELGNLAQQLSPYEAFGLWFEEDFRFYPDERREAFRQGLFGAAGLVAALLGFLWWLRRRELAVVAATAAAAAIYLYLKQTESPYVTAKALVVLSPLLVLMAAGVLLARWRGASREVEAARWALAAVFVGAALVSSAMALRGSQVGPPSHFDELASLRPDVEGGRTLFLGYDDYVFWALRGAWVGDVGLRQKLPAGPRPEKEPSPAVGRTEPGFLYDLDTPANGQLDAFTHVITTRTAFGSEAPPNLRLARRTRSYLLWERRGPTPAREVLREGRAPGRVLDCASPQGSRLSAQAGWARVRARPVVWRPARPVLLGPGDGARLTMRLPAGEWELSARYTSPFELEAHAPGMTGAGLPATIARPGPAWRLGVVRRERPGSTVLTLRGEEPSPFASDVRTAQISALLAVRLDEPARTVPLSRACGRYVDWYVLGRERPRAGRMPA